MAYHKQMLASKCDDYLYGNSESSNERLVHDTMG